MAIIDGVLHPHEEIFIRNLDRFKEVSDEEFDIVRKKCLKISEIEIKEIIERIKDKNKKSILINDLCKLAAADYIIHEKEKLFLGWCSEKWGIEYSEDYLKSLTFKKKESRESFLRFICYNPKCKHEIDFTIEQLEEIYEDIYDDLKKFKSIYEGCKLYNEIECSNCTEDNFYIFNSQGRMVVDPDHISRCSNCQGPIPLPRIETQPETNICLPSCAEEVMENSKLPEMIYPEIPEGKNICPKCNSRTEVRYSDKTNNFFLGCSTFPKCWYKSQLPDNVYFKDTYNDEFVLNLLGSYSDLKYAASVARQKKNKQILDKIKSEIERRIEKREKQNKKPIRTATKTLSVVTNWISSLN